MNKFVYTFALHPAHGSTFSRSMYEWIGIMPLVDMDLTEAEFEKMRYELKLDGFEMHEVSRVPYHDPETVIVS